MMHQSLRRITSQYTLRHLSKVDRSTASTTACPRFFTTATSNAIFKLKSAVEQYRLTNYAQELPSRCKKDLIKTLDRDGNGRISVDSLTSLLNNIGATQTVTQVDVETIINELGDGSIMGTDQFRQIL
mmetsp:Transcript_16906/g.20644  ORF Transcript_16906/g.20644 Transcript_16906/m.20644 type:complete len:128 (+) Transcript_16906:238-621(+)